jgi:hypothetical protein
MKVVLDTNVLISGIFFTGPSHRILKAWRDGQIQFVLTASIIDLPDQTVFAPPKGQIGLFSDVKNRLLVLKTIGINRFRLLVNPAAGLFARRFEARLSYGRSVIRSLAWASMAGSLNHQ